MKTTRQPRIVESNDLWGEWNSWSTCSLGVQNFGKLPPTLSAWPLRGHMTLKSILLDTLFQNLHDFSVLFLNSFMHSFWSSKFEPQKTISCVRFRRKECLHSSIHECLSSNPPMEFEDCIDKVFYLNWYFGIYLSLKFLFQNCSVTTAAPEQTTYRGSFFYFY